MALADTTRPTHLGPGEGRQLRVITDLATIKATSDTTGGAYALIEARTPPSGGVPLHTQHYDDATYIVLAGTYRFHVEDDEFELGPGGYAFVTRGTAHGYANTGDVPARMLVIATPGGVMERFLDEIGDSAARAPWEPDMARVLAVAPKYGVEIRLPPPEDE